MPTLPAPRAILFDLDGTLIDSAPDLGAAANHLRAAQGLPDLPLDAYRSMAGAGARGMIKVALDIAPDDAAFEGLRTAFLNRYESHLCVHTTVFEQIPELLQALQEKGILWGVVTNKAERFTAPLLQLLAKRYPVFASAACIVCGDTTPHPKPHPAPLLHALALIQCEPAQCWYVGDDARDVQAGRAAGLVTVAASYGYMGAAPLHSWGADAVIDAPMELLEFAAVGNSNTK